MRVGVCDLWDYWDDSRNYIDWLGVDCKVVWLNGPHSKPHTQQETTTTHTPSLSLSLSSSLLSPTPPHPTHDPLRTRTNHLSVSSATNWLCVPNRLCLLYGSPLAALTESGRMRRWKGRKQPPRQRRWCKWISGWWRRRRLRCRNNGLFGECRAGQTRCGVRTHATSTGCTFCI